MNSSSSPHIQAGHRDRVLRALGVTAWVRRDAPTRASAHADSPTRELSGNQVACVVVLPQGCDTRELDLIGRALNTGGAVFARAARLVVSDGQLPADVPEAQAYLVFGEAQAHALGRALPAAVMNRAQIVLVDEPALVLTGADAKRRLWNALRSVRRALATAGG